MNTLQKVRQTQQPPLAAEIDRLRERAKEAKALAHTAGVSINLFERACNKAEKTDTGDAWDLLYTLRSTLNEIEAQLS